jgi:hypothetical protein
MTGVSGTKDAISDQKASPINMDDELKRAIDRHKTKTSAPTEIPM